MPLRRIRVLHVVQNLHYGGMERLIAEIIRRIDRARFESHVVGLQFLGRFSEGLDELAHFHVGPAMSKASVLRPVALARFISEIAPDVVHSHSGVWMKSSIAARMARVRRVIHTDHGRVFPIPLMKRYQDRLALRHTHALVAVSAKLAEDLIATDPRYGERLHVIENGVDTTVNRPRPDTGKLRAELQLADDIPIIGSVGRLEPVKAYEVAISALELLYRTWPEERPAPVLVIAGDGSVAEDLRRQASAAGIAHACHFLSWRDDISDLHSCSSLFTMSSRSEGTSVSLLEAMSAEVCPVVTDVGGNAAVLGESLSHRLVPSEDPERLSEAWRSALADAEGRRRDARAARERVVERFDLRRMVEAYEEIYAGREDEPGVPDVKSGELSHG